MITLISASLIYTAIMLIFSGPVLFVARQRELPKMARRFLIAAGVCGLICGVLSAGSERLVNQCEAAGNLSCVDSGSSGFQLMIVAGYLGTSLVRSYLVAHD